MRKILAAVTTGLLLFAGQSAADVGGASARVSDRVGVSAEESHEFAGVPLPILLVGVAVVVATAVIASDDDGESD